MGGVFAPLLGWFFGLVGDEARAEIQRKKARERKTAKERKRKAALAAAAKKRKADWDALMKKHRANAAERAVNYDHAGPPAELDDNPYGD